MKNPSNSRNRGIHFQQLIFNYSQYLAKSRGLSARTIVEYCSGITIFLRPQCKEGKIHLDHLSPKRVIRSFLKYSQKHSASRAQQIVYALRSFFRYLTQAGLIEAGLANIIPSVANKKRTSFPDALSSEMTNKLLQSCDRTDPLGKRNYAILLLMIVLGLRSCEVCNLYLNDLDWDKGEIMIRGKGSEDRFPMLQQVGTALADYLRCGRPNCENLKVFVRSVHPFKGITTACIRHIVSSALDRCNLNPKKRGAHLLRHSFAMQLLEKGASLEEIGIVLRHKDIESTSIYAKANFNNLKAIVQPWPLNVKMEDRHD